MTVGFRIVGQQIGGICQCAGYSIPYKLLDSLGGHIVSFMGSVGMILCASKDDEVVEYAMSRTLSPMMVAEYKLQLPDKAVLQKKLQELINMPLIEE